MEAKEFKIPLILAVVGAALLEFQLVAVQKLPATDSMRALAIYTGINVALSIFGFIVAAKIFDISFGTLGTVCMKLAGTILISAGLAVLMPNAALVWLVWFVVLCSLLIWLFDLEGNEFLWVLVALIVARFLAALAIASIGIGLSQ